MLRPLVPHLVYPENVGVAIRNGRDEVGGRHVEVVYVEVLLEDCTGEAEVEHLIDLCGGGRLESCVN